MTEEKKVVFPSDRIGVEEEFLAGDGTYIEDHEIRSAVFGQEFRDQKRYTAKVFTSSNRVIYPQVGDSVIASVERVSKFSLLAKVFYLNGKKIHPPFSAVMHVTNSAKEYVDKIDDVYAAGDVIRAKIIDAHTIPLQLETKSRETGIIHTWCSQCGDEVQKKGKNKLVCVSCGYKMSRNTSIDYGRAPY